MAGGADNAWFIAHWRAAAIEISRDVEEVVQKLSSDRALSRDEGVKLLGTWEQGGSAPTFCRLLALNTARAKPDYLASGVRWLFIILAANRHVAAGMLFVAVCCTEDMRILDPNAAAYYTVPEYDYFVDDRTSTVELTADVGAQEQEYPGGAYYDVEFPVDQE